MDSNKKPATYTDLKPATCSLPPQVRIDDVSPFPIGQVRMDFGRTLADDLPPLSFGSSRVAQFSADELASLFDAPRLARNFPTQPLDAKRPAQFHWLVVEEEIELDPRPEARTAPFMFMSFNRDFGEIDPHLGRFPQRLAARGLARGVARGLVDVAARGARPRTDILSDLLDRGVQYL